jgi:Tfp pilus assembly protein PilE
MIELMVVMSIIVILSTMAIVQYRHSVILSKETVLRDDLFKMRDAIDQYYADKGNTRQRSMGSSAKATCARSRKIRSRIRRRPGSRFRPNPTLRIQPSSQVCTT